MPTCTRDGAAIWWDFAGEGKPGAPPVMLVAGLGGVSSYWEPQLPDLRRVYRCILHDQRGTGRSSHVPVRDIDQMADDAIAVMDVAGVEKVWFLGHSTGGAIGVSIALRAPERLAGLVINASTTHGDSYRHKLLGLRRMLLEADLRDAYAAYTTLLLHPPWYVNAHADQLAADEARAVAALGDATVQGSRLDAILNFDPREALGTITTPCLVLCARDDILTPLYFSQDYADRIPGAQFTILETGGHAASRTVTQEYNAIVMEFFAGLAAR